MSFNYDRYDSRTNRRIFTSASHSRSALGYWVPLIITVSAATAAVGAWVWNERSKNGDEEDEYVYEYDRDDYDEQRVAEEHRRWQEEHGGPTEPSATGAAISYETSGAAAGYRAAQTTESSTATEPGQTSGQEGGDGFVAQMRGALGRTPSPQQLMSGARSTLNAGIAAVGKGLNSIREGEEDENADYFGDQERWSEEAASRERTDDSRRDIGALGAAAAAGGAAFHVGSGSMPDRGVKSRVPSGRARMVTVIVSSESSDPSYDENETSLNIEHASLLSHVIGHVTAESIQLLVLIYAPHLEKHPLSTSQASSESKTPTSKSRRTSTGSYDKLSDSPQGSNELRHEPPITMQDADDRYDSEGQIIKSYTSNSSPAMYNALATQAATLVSEPTHILPFTTPSGHVHMLKHLAPSLVYIQESLCGERGQLVKEIEGWVGQCVVVVGAEGAGLVDTETEAEAEDEGDKREPGKKWWQDDRIVGLGKGVEVVEGMKLGEDWAKRVEGR